MHAEVNLPNPQSAVFTPNFSETLIVEYIITILMHRFHNNYNSYYIANAKFMEFQLHWKLVTTPEGWSDGDKVSEVN